MKYRYSLLSLKEETVNQLAAFFYMERNKLPRVILLDGEVGAGKTVFSRAYMSTEQKGVSFASPTYTIVREYNLVETKVNHFDIYRITESDYDWIYEFLEDQKAFFLFEWAQLHRALFADVVSMKLEFVYDTLETRNIHLTIDEKYEKMIEEFWKHEGLIYEKCNESVGH